MPRQQVPTSFTAGRPLSIDGTSFAPGDAVPATTVAALRTASALLGRGQLVPNTQLIVHRPTSLGTAEPGPKDLSPAIRRALLS